ncbi:unnamed protein product [Acidithrix sp. C25]|nr:unnamed protein product [Acidithrix sp. C25]
MSFIDSEIDELFSYFVSIGLVIYLIALLEWLQFQVLTTFLDSSCF